ncbi:response regulator receiver domain-containing protein [Actinoallomurus bryophytorum]|uniref:Response regulator receiver domain-containing protein n=1 Tax=Actinoallomurus bryophytorum TaxID=1490222 RepID=A0A543CG87_9ACTN|nr:response regulator receiver domain-containing protein [Actinoallomurus bryophytorum]
MWEGEDTGVAPVLARTVHRTVQEGLTNARRHAPGGTVTVVVTVTADTVGAVVRNGPGTAPGHGPGTGRGRAADSTACGGGSRCSAARVRTRPRRTAATLCGPNCHRAYGRPGRDVERAETPDEAVVHVVVVDDEPMVCEFLRTILSSTGQVVVDAVACDGAAGAEAAVRHRPDVVLMDLRMPGVDGVTATAEIRALPRPPPSWR